MMKMSNSKINDDTKIYINEVQAKITDVKIDVLNVNKFALILNESSNCKKCKALEECKNDTKGYFNAYIKNDDKITFYVKKCKYKLTDEELRNKKNLIETLYLPKNILEANLDEFDLINENRKKAFEYALNFIANYTYSNYMKGMLLYGPFASGKTYLLAGIANELAKKNIKTLLIYFPDLIREIKSSIGTTKFEQLINMLKTVEVLMLDDLGSEMLTAWVRDEIIGPILNYRLMEKLPIFISTNLTIEQMVEHFATTKDEGIDNTKSARIMNRIQGLSIYCDIGSQTYKR